ncbi:MAG TPA: hypothetical protein VHY35_17845 [Stellaceae bacterium]|jgi:hypothetical protein|nr:hypothetical protein [Stellaceae bacterium]
MTIFDGARDLDTFDLLQTTGALYRPARARCRHDWRGVWRRHGALLPIALALGLYAGTVLAVIFSVR